MADALHGVLAERPVPVMSDQALMPPLVLGFLNAMRPMLEERIAEEKHRRSQEWLHAQPWYRDLVARGTFGSGTLAEVLDAQTPGLGVYGSGSYDKGLLQGGGGVRYTMPLDAHSSVTVGAGGGGASGTVHTPIGSRQLGEFFPEAAIAYRRTF